MGTFWQIFQNFGTLFVWWVVIAPWEQAIRVRLGKSIRPLGPGLHLKIPYADIVYKQTVRMRITQIQRQTLSTTDQKTITLVATVGYCIADIQKLYTTLHHAEDTICNIVSARVADVVHSMAATECTPRVVENRVNSDLPSELAAFGLGDPIVRVVDFAAVKTYRLLQDQRWSNGESLDTRQ